MVCPYFLQKTERTQFAPDNNLQMIYYVIALSVKYYYANQQ